MKNYFLILVICSVYSLFGQDKDEYSAIKLYIDQYQILEDNKNNLTENEINRLYQRTSQLVNQAGITEAGYSNFLVSPILDVISNDEDNAGTTKTYLAVCELFITIKRTNIDKEEPLGAATFATFTKKIMGSGFTKEEARSNALSNIRASDEDYRDFFLDTKKKIDEYYKLHCKDVIKEAQQALALKNYVKSISLNFSVPTNSPCYAEAYDSAEKVYQTYIDDKCEKQILLMNNYAALALKGGTNSDFYYTEIIKIIGDISPSSKRCYDAATLIIEKIEKNITEKQKQDWELKKIYSEDEKAMTKERLKEIQKISENYRPQSTLIINK
jgi:hypothetical protein